MYDCQTKCKKDRQFDKTLGACFKIDDLYDELFKKYSKKTYAGKPTKRYLKILKQIQKVGKHTLQQKIIKFNRIYTLI